MIKAQSISSRTQSHFHSPTNFYKSSFIKSPPHVSLNFTNPHLINPIISIRTTRNSPAKSAATNRLYTPSPKETLYELLDISESGTLSEIKHAYKQMALKYHPDVSPLDRIDENTMRFFKIQEAYETLSDPCTRAMYDIDMAKGLYLAFSRKNGTQFEARLEEKQRWQVQVTELKRRNMVDQGGRMSWAARIRKQRREKWAHGSVSGQ